MHVLILAIGSAGDVHPFVGIGRALAERGHRVTLAANPYFERLIRGVGLRFAAIGTLEQYQSLIANAKVWQSARGFVEVARQGILPAVRWVHDLVLEHAGSDTVVVGSTLALGARILQDRFDLPLVSVHLSPSIFRSLIRTPALPGLFTSDRTPRLVKSLQFRVADMMIDSILAGEVNAVRRQHALPPVRRVFDRWFHSPRLVLGLFPDWLAPPQADWPPNVRLTGFPLYDERDVISHNDEADRFLAAGSPPIVFTPGSAMTHGHKFFEASVAACRRISQRGVLLTRFPDQVPRDLGADLRHFEFLPLSWLLPRSAAIVFHGGVGTMSQALAAGTPQLIMPMGFDQPDNAARVIRLGVGASITPKRYQTERVARMLDELVTSASVAENCRAVAARFVGTTPLEDACLAIESQSRSAASFNAFGHA